MDYANMGLWTKTVQKVLSVMLLKEIFFWHEIINCVYRIWRKNFTTRSFGRIFRSTKYVSKYQCVFVLHTWYYGLIWRKIKIFCHVKLRCNLIRVKILVICWPLYLGHGYEHGAWLILLPDIGQAREDQHPHDHHQHQQPQLLVAVPQSHAWISY